MTGGWGKTVVAGVGCAFAAGASFTAVLAQDAQEEQIQGGGFEITGGISNTLQFTDNKSLSDSSAGITTDATSTLRLGISSETALTSLSFGITGGLQFSNSPGGSSDFDVSDPGINFRYSRTGVQSRLSFDANYKERRIEDFVLIDADDDFAIDDLVFDTGDVKQLSYGASFDGGIGLPFGYGLSYRHSERDYSGTVDPDLFDRTTDTVRLSTSFVLSPVLRARAYLSWSEYDAQDVDQTNRETRTFGVGMNYDLGASYATVLDAEIAFKEFDTTTTGFGTVFVNETAVEGSITATRDLPNGALRASLASDVSPETTRITARVDRQIETPDSEFNFGLGISDSDTGGSKLVGGVDFTRELAWGVVSLSFTQETGISLDDDEYLLTEIGAGYLRELTPVSAVDVAFDLAQASDIGFGAIDETRRATLTVTYSQELVQDWDWRFGYEGELADRPGSSRGISHGIFATIDKSFSIRP